MLGISLYLAPLDLLCSTHGFELRFLPVSMFRLMRFTPFVHLTVDSSNVLAWPFSLGRYRAAHYIPCLHCLQE
uniref:Uncharacterized protein n=1 Tax=Arundo donax TaxID=35708 RepID=A0A0A9HUD0_ARUDO